MEDDGEHEFYDTISINSNHSSNIRSRENLGLSRNTIYHSAENMELLPRPETTTPDSPIKSILKHPEQSAVNSKINNRFDDGMTCIDFILVHKSHEHHEHEENIKKRNIFEKNLKDAGLILETDTRQKMKFVKIHAPCDLLSKYAEILKLRLPIKKDFEKTSEDKSFKFSSLLAKLPDIFNVRLDQDKFPSKKYELTAEYGRNKEYLFDVNEKNFFSSATRAMIVDFILERQKFGDDKCDIGIQRLLSTGVYLAAYPLHDGDYKYDTVNEENMRAVLYNEWAQVSKWIKFQPLDYIKDYFGVKHALYFAWLGFYTHMLIPVSLLGIICLIYGLSTMPQSQLMKEVCNPDLNVTMCPLCDKKCDYWELKDACFYTKLSYLVDNPFTLAFAAFMSIWAAVYLELWKRYSAGLTHRWGLTGFDLEAEHPRPQYLARLSDAQKKENAVTQISEPIVPFWSKKLPALIFSFSLAFFWILLAVAAVFGVVLYRMSQITSSKFYPGDSTFSKVLTVPIIAAIMNLFFILILNRVYDYLAVYLTEKEYQRTQTEFDESLSLKIYMFQFVNYYSSLFYLALIKGKFVGYPAKYNKILGYRQEECSPGGCLMELCIQLVIIMVGNQLMNAALEQVIPFLYKLFNTMRSKRCEKDEEIITTTTTTERKQWVQDFKLLEFGQRALFDDYLEMIIQFGFITIFVAAFPLAPLFALINNIFEMRLDAKKFLRYYRRPVPCRVRDIGIWLPVMEALSRLAVISNAFIIAFSSNFIPRLVYMLVVSADHKEDGYLDFLLARFNTADFQMGVAPLNPSKNVTTCMYLEFRNPPDHESKYKRPLIYWEILAFRLLFIVIFQNVIGFLMSTLKWAIPDQPRKLSDQIKREGYLIRDIIIKNEDKKDKEEKIKEINETEDVGKINEVFVHAGGDNNVGDNIV